MAIHTKVGILSQIPGASASVTPGLIDGLYADFLTKELDFMDDSLIYPRYEWFTSPSFTYTGSYNWEDLGTTWRAWRYEYTKEENEYWLTRSSRSPFKYKNFVQDPTVTGANPLEIIRLVFPAPNGDFNIPYPNPKGSDHYSYHNSSMPLLHNRTKFRIPLVEAAYSYSVFETDNIEDQSWVRDNQAEYDSKMVEINSLNSQWDAIIPLVDAKSLEYGSLIDSGADQGLIDTAYSELLALQAQQGAFGEASQQLWSELGTISNASNFLAPDTMAGRRDKLREGRERWQYLVDQIVVRDLTPEETTEMELLESNERVLFVTSDIYASMWSDERFSNVYNSSYSLNLTNHPLGTMPSDVLPGITDINWLPGVLSKGESGLDLLPATGNPGDVIRVAGYAGENAAEPQETFAWDPQNSEWSQGFYYRFLADIMTTACAKRDPQLKAKNELMMSMRPAQFAGFYIPAFAITFAGEGMFLTAYETLQA